MKANKIFHPFKLVLLLLLTTVITTLQAQQLTDLTTLTAFQSPSENWQLVGNARADLDQFWGCILNKQGEYNSMTKDKLFFLTNNTQLNPEEITAI